MHGQYGSIHDVPTALLHHVETTPSRCSHRAGLRPVTVVAFADDVTVFLTSAADISTLQEAIQHFERASGTSLNPRKSHAPLSDDGPLQTISLVSHVANTRG
jgi:hypothetical protein